MIFSLNQPSRRYDNTGYPYMDTVYLYSNINVAAKAVRSCKRGGTGVMCCRIDRPPLGFSGDAIYKVTFAFCSPVDNFSRKEAHDKLKKRMDLNKYVTLKLKEKKRNLREVMYYAVQKVLNEKPNLSLKNSGTGIPQWALSNVVNYPDGKPRYIKATPRRPAK